MKKFIFFSQQLCFLLLFSISFVSLFKNKYVASILSFILGLLWISECCSIYLGGTLIDYKFYAHLSFNNVLELFYFFWFKFLLALLGILIISILIFRISRTLIKRKDNYSWFMNFILSGFLIFMMNGYNEVVHNLYETIRLVNTTQLYSFENSLELLEINEYTPPEEVEATPGKNIIILSLESVEKGYLEEPLTHLTPNLSQLKSEWNFHKMSQSQGSNWTTGSMYTFLSGLPSYLLYGCNRNFQNTNQTRITGLSHVLKSSGYDMSYLIGKPDFGGIEDLLSAYDIPVKSEKNFDTKYPEVRFGLHDKDLFFELEKEIKEKSKNNQPFAVFASTISTHFPNGIYDKRMESFVQPQRSNLEFMVKASDYLIGELINNLEEEGILSNTVVYIFPDHILMGTTATVLKDFKNERGLYILTNASKKDLNIPQKKEIHQIDLPKIILEGAGVKHNAKFFTDFILREDKENYINENKALILSLNEAGIHRSITSTPISNDNDIKNDVTRFIAHGGGKINGEDLTNSLEALNNSYQKGFRLFELDIIKTKDNHFVAAHDWKTWSERTNFKSSLPPTLKQFLNHPIKSYTPLGMKEINNWFTNHPDAILITDKTNEPLPFSSQFIDKKRLMMEVKTMQAVHEGLQANILSTMPNQAVLNKMIGNKPNILKNLGIKHVIVPRKMIFNQPLLLSKLKEEGIKAYVYLIKNEKYTVEHELNMVYGLYADDWIFSN